MTSTTPSLMNVLLAVPVLTGLNTAALQLLIDEGTLRDMAAGELVVREGTPGHSFFIMVEGDVEVIKRYDTDHAVTLAVLHRGNFFGEMCVVDPVPRAATVRAQTAGSVLEITSATLYHLFRKMPDQYAIMVLNLARDLARRLRLLDEAYAARAS